MSVVDVLVNGRKVSLSVKKLSYDDLIELAGFQRFTNDVKIIYRRGRRFKVIEHGKSINGELIQNGDVFEVTREDEFPLSPSKAGPSGVQG